MYFEVLMAVFQVAWMGITTTLFELTIDIMYWFYDSLWMGFVGNMCEAFTGFPGIGPIVDTIWGMCG